MRFRLLIPLFLLSFAVAPAADLPRPAGELEFRTHEQKTLTLESCRGKVVGVMFFSTDCPHCQSTAQLLGPIYEQYKDKGFEILALAVNPKAAMNLKKFAADYNVKFPIGLSTSMQWKVFAKLPAMARSYVPHLLFVDRDGNIVEDHPGQDREFWTNQEQLIKSIIERLLAKKAS